MKYGKRNDIEKKEKKGKKRKIKSQDEVTFWKGEMIKI